MTVPATLAEGAQGPTVKWAQYLLVPGNLDRGGIDGIFGAATKKAVEGFQAASHLTVDGVVGPATWGALGGERPEPPTLLEGSHGTVVEKLQAELNDGRGDMTPASTSVLVVDGSYGPQTTLVVKAAQREAQITVDGVVGLQTWSLSAHAAGGTLASECGLTSSNDV